MFAKEKVVNIIVVGYNTPTLDSACMAHLERNTKHPYVLTYFDNFKTNYSLTALWNKLIEASPCQYICLLNNDTEVGPGWLVAMLASLGGNIGFVGPSTNECHGKQKTIRSFQAACEHIGEFEIVTEPLSGFCLLFEKVTWSLLKGFDERYTLYGQESDLIDRADKQLGLKCAWRKDAFVYHHGEASSKIHRIDVTKEREKAKALYWKERT